MKFTGFRFCIIFLLSVLLAGGTGVVSLDAAPPHGGHGGSHGRPTPPKAPKAPKAPKVPKAPKAPSRPSPRPAPKPQSRSMPKPQSRPSSRPPQRSEVRPQSRPTSRPEMRPQSRPPQSMTQRPQSRPEARPNSNINRPSGNVKPMPWPNSRKPNSGSMPNNHPDVKPPRPNDRPNDRPGMRPDNRPGERPDAKPPRPNDRPNDRPGMRPDNRPGERPDVKPPRPNDRPNDRPDMKPPRPANHRPNDYHPGHGFTPRPTHPAPPPGGHHVDHHHHPPHHRYYSPFWGALFFLPPPPPMYYYEEQVIVYPPTIVSDGLEYYDDTITSAPITETPEVSIADLADPMNRFYTWDAFRYYGWLQQYQPFHESWRDACDQGIGFAAAYDTSVSRYHYYPVHSVRPGTELITDNDGLTTIFTPEKEKDAILPLVETTLPQTEVDEAWEQIYAGDEYFRNARPSSAEEQYARAMVAQREMPDPWFRLAVVQLSRKQYHDAFQSITSALELSHQWPVSPFTLSQMYGYQTLKKQQDIDALRQARQRAPQNAELQLVYAFMLYADSLGDVDKGKETRAEFQRAAQLNPLLAPELENIISFLNSEIERVESKK